jgi:succinate-semialdehyde dehydrogenase/glutarate-semialdehyde dehydrogenase
MSITDKAPGTTSGIGQARIEEVLGRTPTGLLINGAWRAASDGGTFEVENPATGEVIATLASATRADAAAAMDAAATVQEGKVRCDHRFAAAITAWPVTDAPGGTPGRDAPTRGR